MNIFSNLTVAVPENRKAHQPIRSINLVRLLNIYVQNSFKYFSKLIEKGLSVKQDSLERLFIENNYIYISQSGEMIRGLQGFYIWSEENGFNFDNEKKAFIQRVKAVNRTKKDGLIPAKKLILIKRKDLFLNNIFFSDFYRLDYFGNTKLGQLVYLSKRSQNKALISEITQLIKKDIQSLIDKYNIGLVCFIPPTIYRKIQFLDVLKEDLELNIKEVQIAKLANQTKVPQKTLKTLENRIANAQATIIIDSFQKIESNVLIIDDAITSGTTMNETAKKIRTLATKSIKIYGYAIVGNNKSVDVINEV